MVLLKKYKSNEPVWLIFCISYLGLILRKPDFCLCENKGADQLRSNCKADHAFVFAKWIVQFSSTYSQNFKHLACLCDCTAQFVSHLVGNPKDLLSRDVAHLLESHSSSIAKVLMSKF